MTALFSFLGSGLIRWLLEKVFGMMERKQDHAQELELREQQEKIDSASHARNLELLERQSALNLKFEEAKHQGAMEDADLKNLGLSIENAKPTGVGWVDAWNGSIRPALATVSTLCWLGLLAWLLPDVLPSMTAAQKAAFATLLVDFSLSLIGAVLGWYVASRSLMPSKK